MEWLLTPLIVVGVILLVIAIVVLVIKAKINSLTHQYLGKSAGETARFLADGLKNETTLPKSITNMTAVFKPAIERDFPELGFDGMIRMAENGLISILNTIESENIGQLDAKASDKLKKQVDNIISDNQSISTKHCFDNVKIHKTGVARYNNSGKSAVADFEISMQCNEYTICDDKVKSGSKDELTQAVYKVTLAYNQEQYLETTSILHGSNCPNCGAPVSAIGNDKCCPYCGTGLTEISDRVWQIDSFKLLK